MKLGAGAGTPISRLAKRTCAEAAWPIRRLALPALPWALPARALDAESAEVLGNIKALL